MKGFALFVVVAGWLVAAGGCAVRNTAICCTDGPDCMAAGLPAGTRCEPGFACEVAMHSCVKAECSLDTDCPTDRSHCEDGVCKGCDATFPCSTAAPVCEADTTCGGCTGASDCSAFPDTPVCGSDGACHAVCTVDTDCPSNLSHCDHNVCVGCDAAFPCDASAPVCGATATCGACAHNSDCAAFPDLDVCGADGACHTCTKDSECDSQACEAGQCIASADVLYVSTTGTDAGTCTQAAPCKTLTYAVTQSRAVAQHIVMAGGTYNATADITISHPGSGTTSWTLHGNNSTIIGGGTSLLRGSDVSLSDLTFVSYGLGITNLDGHSLTLLNAPDLVAQGSTTFHDLTATNTNFYIGFLSSSGHSLSIYRAKISNGFIKTSRQGNSLTLENVSMHVASGPTLSFPEINVSGSAKFSSFLSDAGTEPVADCGTNGSYTMDRVIAYAPGTNRAAIAKCLVTSSIVGPMAYNLNSHSDPQFADTTLHIMSTSPAKDATACDSDAEAKVDFDGDARPIGSQCDIGADEFKP